MLLRKGLEWNTGMRAYVQIEYAADGPSPARVDEAVSRAGFRREGIYYVVEGNMIEGLSELHGALRGTGVSFTVVPNPSPTERWSGATRDVAQHWREDGLIDGEGLDLLETDPLAFREAAYRTAGAAIERLATMREAELDERRKAIMHHGKRDDIIVMLKASGGMTAHQVGEALDAPEEEVFDALAGMVQDGSVLAQEVGHSIVYLLAERTAVRR